MTWKIGKRNRTAAEARLVRPGYASEATWRCVLPPNSGTRAENTSIKNSYSYNDVLGDTQHEKIKRDIRNIKCRGRGTKVEFLYTADVVIHTQ